MSYPRTGIYRFVILLGLCLLAHQLFIYKIDVRATVNLAQGVLPRSTNINQNTSTVVETTSIATGQTSHTSQKTTKKEQTTNVLNDVQKSNMSGHPKEAFVTFSNNNPTYLALLYVLLDSVHAFSTRPIICFGIDVDLIIDLVKYPRVIKRRIQQKDCGPSVYFCKLHAIVSSNVDYGVLMETDDVVNYNVDVLFDILHVWPYPLPISPRHPDDPRNYDHFMRQHNVPKRTTPYIHAHMIWNYRAHPFLKNLHSLLQQGNFQGSNFDETAVNVMLWKERANHTVCTYDPYFKSSDIYERWPIVTNCTSNCHTVYVTMHGCKYANISSALFNRLKANAGKPTVQTIGSGGMHYINDTSVTCCYPDSKPSPIHPLLCEHPPPA